MFGAAAALAFAGALAFVGQAGGHPDSHALWGAALTMADGAAGPGAALASGAPAAHLLTMLAGWIAPARTLPAPDLAAALAAALMVVAWLGDFRAAGRGWALALAAAALLCLNPIFLHALRAGPAPALTVLGFWLCARNLTALRANGAAPAVIGAASGLLLMSLTGPAGMILTLAAAPFALLAAPPELVARSAAGVILSVFFPAVFAVNALVFAAWLFAAESALPIVDLWRQAMLAGAGAPRLAALGPLLAGGACAAPVALALALRARRRLPILAPVLSLFGAALAGAAGARLLGAPQDDALLLAPLLGLAALSARLWPGSGVAAAVAPVLLAAGAAGSLWLTPPTELANDFADHGDLGERAAGAFLAGRTDIMLDAARWPALVAARGSARGLIAPGQGAFAAAALTRAPSGAYVAVPDPGRALGRPDAVHSAFPRLHAEGAPGYRLVYDRAGWRIYARSTDPASEANS